MANQENKPTEPRDFRSWYVLITGVGLVELIGGLISLYQDIKDNNFQDAIFVRDSIMNGTLLTITGFLAFHNSPNRK